MTTTKYDARRARELDNERDTILKKCRAIVDGARAEGRDLTKSEQESIEAGTAKIKAGDPERQALGKALVDSVIGLGSAEDDPFDDASPGNLFGETARKDLVMAVKTRSAFRTEVDTKAALTSGTMLPSSGTGVESGLYPNAFPLATLLLRSRIRTCGPLLRARRRDR